MLQPIDQARAEVVDHVNAATARGRVEHGNREAQHGLWRHLHPATLDIQVEGRNEQAAGGQQTGLLEIPPVRFILQLRCGDDAATPVDSEDLASALIEVAHLIVSWLLNAEKGGATDCGLQGGRFPRLQVGPEAISIREQPQVIGNGPQLALQQLRKQADSYGLALSLSVRDLSGLAAIQQPADRKHGRHRRGGEHRTADDFGGSQLPRRWTIRSRRFHVHVAPARSACKLTDCTAACARCAATVLRSPLPIVGY